MITVQRLDERPDVPHPLGRHVEHDDRSRRFNAGALARRDVKPVEWARVSGILDQGSIGACTGFAMAGLLGCKPWCGDPIMFGPNEGLWLYAGATRADAFPGWWPQEDTGSSGVAVAKVARDLNMIRGWATAFTTADLLNALMHGPVLLGTVWTDAMFDPDRAGEVVPDGPVAGGHEYVCRGWDGRRLICDNSWGERWGVGGSFAMTLASWERLRAQDADVTVPIL